MCLSRLLTIIFYDQFLLCSTSAMSILGNKEVTYNLSRLEVMRQAQRRKEKVYYKENYLAFHNDVEYPLKRKF